MINNVTFGSDPEYFIINKDTEMTISGIGLINGTKKNPEPLGDDFFVLKDNILAEGNIPPASDPIKFMHNLMELKTRILKYLHNIDGIQLAPIQDGVLPNYAYFPIVIDEKKFGTTRNEVFDVLAANNIFTRKYFYPLTSAFDCYHGMFNVLDTPVALHISKRVLTLPMFADLPLEDVKRICNIIESIKK